MTDFLRTPVMLVGVLSATLHTGCESEARSPLTEGRQVGPLEDAGPMSVRIREVWRRELGEEVDARGGMAVWEDGTIWIGGREGIWEMSPQGETLRALSEPAAADRGYALALLAMPDRRSVVLVSRNGTTFYPRRDGAAGVFSAMHRNSVPGVAALQNDHFVLSYGQYPDDPHVAFALHRYSRDGSHVGSWHPAFPADDWRVVTQMTGGPVTTTLKGDLLLAEKSPPFRIVRYAGGWGDSAAVVVEDETIVPRDELHRALPKGNRGVQWNRPVFIDQMHDGNILTVIRYYPTRRRSRQGLWVVVSPTGDMLARTRFPESYELITPTGVDGRYLAWIADGIVALDVAVEPLRDGQR